MKRTKTNQLVLNHLATQMVPTILGDLQGLTRDTTLCTMQVLRDSIMRVAVNYAVVDETMGAPIPGGTEREVYYTITDKGRLLISEWNAMEALVEDDEPTVVFRRGVAMPRPAVRVDRDYEVYRGTELGQTCMRPGAYDAFAKPSLISGERKYRG